MNGKGNEKSRKNLLRLMHLIFFDEVKHQNDYPYYHIGGICVHESSLKDIENEVNEISQSVFGERVLKKETEFHAHEIYHKKGRFKEISDVDKRINIMLLLVKILERESVKLIDIRINTEKVYYEKSAADYAFMFLCEKVDDLMRSERSLGLLIGDRENDKVTNRYSKALSQYRIQGTNYAFRKHINHIFESVHFTPSHLSRFLQLADIYSWVLQYQKKNSKSSKNNEFIERLSAINLFPTKYKHWPL